MSRLAFGGEITDEAGLASAVLAAEVGYPGSSIAFAQLLSGMQRSGLIEREVRGKRTYRITAAAGAFARVAADAQARPARRPSEPGQAGRRATAQALAVGEGGTGLAAGTAGAAGTGAAGVGLARPAGAAGTGAAGVGLAGPAGAAGTGAAGVGLAGPAGAGAAAAAGAAGAGAGPGDVDYDELARRLLVQVMRRLASAPGDEPAGPGGSALEQTVAGLERELASVRTMHGSLTAENARLREQLTAARRSLALAQDRASTGRPVSDHLDAAEVNLLARLLAPSADGSSREDAETG